MNNYNNLEDTKHNESIILSKYNIYVSRTRNIFSLSSLALAIIAFSNSTLFDQDYYKPYIKFIGIFILIIANFYGWDNMNDYENYVIKHNINKKTTLLDDKSINNDINLIKIFLILMITIIILAIISFFY